MPVENVSEFRSAAEKTITRLIQHGALPDFVLEDEYSPCVGPEGGDWDQLQELAEPFYGHS